MKIKIRIRTPAGEAEIVAKRLKKFFFGLRDKYKAEINSTKDTIVWKVEGDPRKILKIQRKIGLFDEIIKSTMDSWIVKRKRKKLSKEDQALLNDMLLNQTSIEVLPDN